MKFRIMILVIIVLGTASQLVAQSFAKVNINNVSTFVWNDGRMDNNVSTGNAGFEYWKGTKRYSVFTSGVYWGGYCGNELRIGGTKFRTSLRPGNESGDTIIYKIRPDYKTANLSGEMNDERRTEDEIRKQYATDYENWPVHLGAPFDDVDQNGLFRKGKDIPGFPNADQTLWQVCNDFEVNDFDLDLNPFYSDQTNVEVQITTWAYSKYDLLKGVVFKNYKLINKSKTQTIKEMYLGIFSDPDLGDAGDDYAGCDTTLNLAYVYNSKANDTVLGENLTSIGCLLLQSPIIDGTVADIANVNRKNIYGMKNIGMSSFSINRFEDMYMVTIGDRPVNYYNHLLGLSYHGRPAYDPILKRNTKFPLSGDPVTKSGFIDGIIDQPGDRRIQINSGPFNMAPGDTQEVIFAQIVTSSTSRLGSVSYLKYLAKYVKDFYMNGMFPKITDVEKETELPTHFSLEQNYPNPFNPETMIGYQLSAVSHVSLKVYDVLGREISTLVDEVKQPGIYNSKLSIRNYKLSSGVYFYTLRAGSFVQTKKMMLLK